MWSIMEVMCTLSTHWPAVFTVLGDYMYIHSDYCWPCHPLCRRRKLDEIKQRKLSELRAAGIPEKYCAEVSRRITAPAPSFTMSQLN